MATRIKVKITKPIMFEGVRRKAGQTVAFPPDHPMAKKPRTSKSSTAPKATRTSG